MPAPAPNGQLRPRLTLLAPLIPLVVLLAAMGATDVLARDPSGGIDQPFSAAPDEVNRAMGLVPSEACDGLLTSASLAASGASGIQGCTHGLDLHAVDDTQPQAVSAAGELPPVPQPPGIPCYRSGPNVKVLYIYDQNGTSKINQRKPLIREIVAQADKVIDDSASEHSVRRHVRWLMSSTCKLKVVAVPANLGLDVISLRANLVSRGLLSNAQKGLAFTESFGYGGCSGIAEVREDDRAGSNNGNNSGGMLALVYAGCWTTGESVLVGTEVATHELLHTLGAVQRSAPNSTPMFHCTDESDVMCYPDGTGLPMRDICPINDPELLDCQRNDYFNPSPPAGSYLATHWNIARSAYLASPAPEKWDRLARPTVSISGPTGTVSGTVTFTANANAPSGATITQVAFEVNGVYWASDTSAPYRLQLNTLPENGGWANGQSIKVVAYAVDNFFRWKGSATKQVTVGNPKVRMVTPTEYDFASGDMPWSAAASAGKGRTVAKVELLVDGVVKATDTTAPYGGTWDARAGWGPSLQVRVTDSTGARRTSSQRWVTVTPPTIELVRPLPWASTFADESILFGARASAAPGVGVKRVEFLVNGVKVGTDSTAPYTYLHDTSTVADGTSLNVKARVIDDRNHQVISSIATVQVEHDGHVATLTAPSSGATVSGSNVALSASVSATAGSEIYAVTFMVDGQSVAWDYEAPFEGTWDTLGYGFGNGGHVISVQAEVWDGIDYAYVESAGTAVVVANPQTTLSVTGPAAGATVKGNVTVTASVSLAAGDSIYSVEFYAGSVWIGSDDTAPYRITWNSTYNHDATVPLRATAWSSVSGAEVSSPTRNVQLANLWARPSTPAAGATVSGNVTLQAKTHLDSEGQIESVKFLVDNKVVRTDWTKPYSVSWKSSSVANGVHKLKVRATTIDGRTVTSSARSFTVAN